MPGKNTPASDDIPATSQSAATPIVGDSRGKNQPPAILLMGPTTSGKTAVAIYAMLAAVGRGHQAALMTPTELLARQHAASLTSLLAGSSTCVDLIAGSQSRAHRRETLQRIASGEIHIIVGTQALVRADMNIIALGLLNGHDSILLMNMRLLATLQRRERQNYKPYLMCW